MAVVVLGEIFVVVKEGLLGRRVVFVWVDDGLREPDAPVLEGVLFDADGIGGARLIVLLFRDPSLMILPPLMLSDATLFAVESSSTESSKWPVFPEKVFQSHSPLCDDQPALQPAAMPSTAARGSSFSRNKSQSQ